MSKNWSQQKYGLRRYLRGRRITKFARILDSKLASSAKERITVLDVGGRINYWLALQDKLPMERLHIFVLNLDAQEALDGVPSNFQLNSEQFSILEGNACQLEFSDSHFDIVHSNSVIEHLGSWQNMKAAASEIARVSDGYFVQVPYFWFPFEPHFRSFFFHWLPEQVRAKMLMKRRIGLYGPYKKYDDAINSVRSARLLDLSQMRSLFPDADIKYERVPFIKSLMATKEAGLN